MQVWALQRSASTLNCVVGAVSAHLHHFSELNTAESHTMLVSMLSCEMSLATLLVGHSGSHSAGLTRASVGARLVHTPCSRLLTPQAPLFTPASLPLLTTSADIRHSQLVILQDVMKRMVMISACSLNLLFLAFHNTDHLQYL